MTVVALRELPAPDGVSLRALLDRAGAARRHPALPEPQLLAATHHGEAPAGERIVLARDGDGKELAGCAVLSPARDGSTVLHLAVDPVTGRIRA